MYVGMKLLGRRVWFQNAMSITLMSFQIIFYILFFSFFSGSRFKLLLFNVFLHNKINIVEVLAIVTEIHY